MIYPEHIQWIINNRTESLHKALSQDNSYKNIENYFDIFLSADPTSKKKLTQWLVDTYINGGFKWEDIQSGSSSKVFDTLSLYIKHKSKLDSSNRDLQVNANDISQYSSLGSVYEDIAPFIKLEKSSRSVKRENRVRAYEESEVLIKYNDGEFTKNSLMVVIPKTEYASKWWGRGTQWCTAGDKNNMFDNYYKDGPLVVIIVNDIKTQLHINLVNNNTPVQFMNEHDIDINLKFVKDNWTLLSPIMEWAINKNGTTLRLIPELLRTAELCLCAVSKNAEAIRYVPQLLLTTEICLVAVRKNGNTLRFIDNHLMAEEICLEAVRQNGRALEYIPEYLMTHELCLEAVRQNGYSLRHVPESLRIAELCLETVRQNGYYLQYVPKILITAELCLEAVKQDGNALYHVPEALRTEEL